MFHHRRQKLFAIHRKHSAGKFYPVRFTRQIWLLRITTCFHRWITYLLSSALFPTKMWKNGSLNVSQQMGKEFYCRGILKLPERWKKCVTSDGAHFEWNTFYHSSRFNVFFKEKNDNDFTKRSPSILVPLKNLSVDTQFRGAQVNSLMHKQVFSQDARFHAGAVTSKPLPDRGRAVSAVKGTPYIPAVNFRVNFRHLNWTHKFPFRCL